MSSWVSAGAEDQGTSVDVSDADSLAMPTPAMPLTQANQKTQYIMPRHSVSAKKHMASGTTKEHECRESENVERTESIKQNEDLDTPGFGDYVLTNNTNVQSEVFYASISLQSSGDSKIQDQNNDVTLSCVSQIDDVATTNVSDNEINYEVVFNLTNVDCTETETFLNNISNQVSNREFEEKSKREPDTAYQQLCSQIELDDENADEQEANVTGAGSAVRNESSGESRWGAEEGSAGEEQSNAWADIRGASCAAGTQLRSALTLSYEDFHSCDFVGSRAIRDPLYCVDAKKQAKREQLTTPEIHQQQDSSLKDDSYRHNLNDPLMSKEIITNDKCNSPLNIVSNPSCNSDILGAPGTSEIDIRQAEEDNDHNSNVCLSEEQAKEGDIERSRQTELFGRSVSSSRGLFSVNAPKTAQRNNTSLAAPSMEQSEGSVSPPFSSQSTVSNSNNSIAVDANKNAAKTKKSEFARITSKIEKKYRLSSTGGKMETKGADKFVVSFNSDTSDSEDSDIVSDSKSTSSKSSTSTSKSTSSKSSTSTSKSSSKSSNITSKSTSSQSSNIAIKEDTLINGEQKNKKKKTSSKSSSTTEKKSKQDENEIDIKNKEKNEKKAKKKKSVDLPSSDIQTIDQSNEKPEKKSKRSKSEKSDSTYVKNETKKKEKKEKKSSKSDKSKSNLISGKKEKKSKSKDKENAVEIKEDNVTAAGNDLEHCDAEITFSFSTSEVSQNGVTQNGVVGNSSDDNDVTMTFEIVTDASENIVTTDEPVCELDMNGIYRADGVKENEASSTQLEATENSQKETKATQQFVSKREERNAKTDNNDEDEQGPGATGQSESLTDHSAETEATDNNYGLNAHVSHSANTTHNLDLHHKSKSLPLTNPCEDPDHHRGGDDIKKDKEGDNKERDDTIDAQRSLDAYDCPVNVVINSDIKSTSDPEKSEGKESSANNKSSMIASLCQISDKENDDSQVIGENNQTGADIHEKDKQIYEDKKATEAEPGQKPGETRPSFTNNHLEIASKISHRGDNNDGNHEKDSGTISLQANVCNSNKTNSLLTPSVSSPAQDLQESLRITDAGNKQNTQEENSTHATPNPDCCEINTNPESSLCAESEGESDSKSTEQNHPESSARDYSSQSIKSIYFSGEFDSSVKTSEETMGDNSNEESADMNVNIQENKQTSKTVSSTLSAEDKYEKIRSQVHAGNHIVENGLMEQRQLQTQEHISSSSTVQEKKTSRSFSQDSYEAAVNRAFSSSASKESRFIATSNASNTSASAVNNDSQHSGKVTTHQHNSTENGSANDSSLYAQSADVLLSKNASDAYETQVRNDANTSNRLEANNTAAQKHIFDATENSKAPLKMASNTDGRDTLERTTTFLAGDRNSTDELIKRILAESKSELSNSRSYRKSAQGGNLDIEIDGERVTVDTPSGVNRLAEQSKNLPTSSGLRSPDLLSPRSLNYGIAQGGSAMGDNERIGDKGGMGENREPGDDRASSINEPRRGMYDNEELADMASPHNFRSPHSPHDDPFDDSFHSAADQNRRYRSGFMQKQAAIYDDYAASFRMAANRYAHYNEEDDSDDDSYRPSSRRRQQGDDMAFADEEFIPQKADDTDQVVQERTAEIRNVVDNQNQVLTRLKSASDSFDELNDEIKQIKQQFLESTMRRTIILDDIEYEREQWEREMIECGQSPYEQDGGRYRRRQYGMRSRAVDYDNEFEQNPTNYRPYSTRAGPTLDKDLESDQIGSGALQNLAIKSGYASNLASAARTDDYDDLDDTRFSARPSFSNMEDMTSRARRGRSLSMFDDSDFGFEPRARGSGARFGGHTNGYDDDDNDDAQSYTSPNLPSYRKYDSGFSGKSSENADRSRTSYRGGSMSRDYTGSYSSKYSTGGIGSATGSRFNDDMASSTSGDSGSGRYGNRSFQRSQTLDSYSFDSPTRIKYSSLSTTTSSSGFSSRFLSKVREKKAAGEDIKTSRDKPFSSRFLGNSMTFDSPYSSTNKKSSYSSRDTTTTSDNQSAASKQDEGATASES